MLEIYESKKVIIETHNNKIFRGFIGDYVYPEDNENGEESIIIDAFGHPNPIEFYPDEIKSITVME